MSIVTKFNHIVNAPDLGKLVLRLGFAGFFLFHGVHKLYAGTDFIQKLFSDFGLPAELAYLVYLGEVIALVLIIIGLWTRLAGLIDVGTSVVVIILMHHENFFTLTNVGAWTIEHIGTFLVGFLAIMLLGSGKYSVQPD